MTTKLIASVRTAAKKVEPNSFYDLLKSLGFKASSDKMEWNWNSGLFQVHVELEDEKTFYVLGYGTKNADIYIVTPMDNSARFDQIKAAIVKLQKNAKELEDDIKALYSMRKSINHLVNAIPHSDISSLFRIDEMFAS